MSRHSSNRAILVLESPWGLDSSDTNRSSVLPFIEGVAKLAGDTEVYHANFYDKSSFMKALDCLCKRRFRNTIVYIAAHGYKKKIGNVNIGDLMFSIGEKSKECNITGLMFGSCFVGENTNTMETYIEGTHIKWCAGYASASAWLEGTLIDCAILSNMSNLDDDDYHYDREVMIQALGRSISGFSGTFNIGEDYKECPVKLSDSMQFVIQPSGRGYKAKTVTAEVFAAHKAHQL